jgi:hypothetical protein
LNGLPVRRASAPSRAATSSSRVKVVRMQHFLQELMP